MKIKMSKQRPEAEYKKTKAYRFFRWLSGEKDPYLNEVEMKVQSEEIEPVPHAYEKKYRKMQRDLYQMETNRELRWVSNLYKIMAPIFCVVLLTLLLVTVSYLPPTGSPTNPDNNEVSARYIERGLQETGAVNIVTGMILDYRAFDTFGESNVLFIATITVFVLLRKTGEKKDETGKDAEEENEELYEPQNDAILQKIATILVPIIIIFGIYVILNGHLSPGGGFSGGAIIGAGLILHLNAFGFKETGRFFTAKTYKWICFVALSFYCIAKSYSFFTGANHIPSGIPLGTPGAILSSGLILPLNICVGAVVACTMYAFYVMFRKGEF